MRGVLFRLAVVGLAFCVASVAQADLRGTARVVDGDTLDIAGERVRLLGLDAPESDQTCLTEQGAEWRCGAWVSQELRALLRGHTVTCRDEGRDAYGRILGRCSLDGQDLSALLVGLGYAWVNPRYELTYQPQEKQAAIALRGLWAMSSLRPWEHRVARTVGREAPSADCVIKGNISDSGRIYHVPGQQHYDRTGIRPEQGERWFCSTLEAERAGWRAARR